MAQLALTAARKAGLSELEKEAALVLVEWSQPITDEVQAKARQRLADRGALE